MQPKVINVEHSTGTAEPNINQHYQQHFQQHYAAASESNPDSNPRFPTNQMSGSFQNIDRPFITNRTPTGFDSHSQIVRTIDQNGNNVQSIEQKHEQRKTVHTTTTTTSKPVLVGEAVITANTPLNAIFVNDARMIENETQPIVAQSTRQSAYSNNSNADPDDHYSYSIKVEHHPISPNAINWSNIDTYLHIFLTFYFGSFATLLIFDGIIRNIINLFLLEHSIVSPFIYVIHIIFSICFLAFTVWFMTICWRWWRHKSLTPSNELPFYENNQRTLKPNVFNAHGYMFVAACILIIGLLFYLILGVIDLSYKRKLNKYHHLVTGYNTLSYTYDLIMFVLRVILWVLGIVITLLLSRNVLIKHCCPSKQIKIDKEKPTTVYEVKN